MSTVTNLLGIENLKKVFAELIEAGNVVGEIMAMPSDMSWYQKITPVVKILDESVALFSVEWKQVLPEAQDLTAEEKAELQAFFVEKFKIPQTEAEEKVEKCFAALLKLVEVVLEIVAIAKALKNQPTPPAE